MGFVQSDASREGARESGSARRGLFLAPFDELVDPRVLADLGTRAETQGWDGLFLWDHMVYRAPVRAVADPWVALSAIASATNSLRLGPMVTPVSRRRVHKLARETVTLDHLSGGRLILASAWEASVITSSGPSEKRLIRESVRACSIMG